MAYPASEPINGFNRLKVDTELASFFAGTQARTFREISLAASASVIVRMQRPVDIAIRQFELFVNSGEIRCEIYRGATPGGNWSESLPVISKNEMNVGRPTPLYVPQSSLQAGGTISGGTLYDVIHVKTSGGSGQQGTVGSSQGDVLGAPGGSVGYYKFSNPGNSTATGIWRLWWTEFPQ